MTDAAKVRTTLTKRVERTYDEGEVEAIMADHFRAKRGFPASAPVIVEFDVSQGGGFLRSITVCFEETQVKDEPE